MLLRISQWRSRSRRGCDESRREDRDPERSRLISSWRSRSGGSQDRSSRSRGRCCRSPRCCVHLFIAAGIATKSSIIVTFGRVSRPCFSRYWISSHLPMVSLTATRSFVFSGSYGFLG
ncbi:hypothetical protein TIFTF001_020097 [Ficus carica]|uniref:Uncharacterized protein n=1 Tax=Ficus carica TaxID=3494 RepID=A0AA88AR90_FICCA|nr:hypothetical protein TIFTF001_020097 [Ficus carica]